MCDANPPCTPQSAKFVCSPAEVNILRKINLDHTPQSRETQKALNRLCEEHINIFYYIKVLYVIQIYLLWNIFLLSYKKHAHYH